MSKIPGEIIKSISHLKKPHKKLKQTRENYRFQRKKNLFVFVVVVVVLDRSIYMNMAEVADYEFVGKYLAKTFMGKVYKTEKKEK